MTKHMRTLLLLAIAGPMFAQQPVVRTDSNKLLPGSVIGSWGAINNTTALTAGTTVAGCGTAKINGTIYSWTARVSPSGATATFKLWKTSSTTVLPTVSDSINTSGVGISSGTMVTSTTLTDFTSTSVSIGDTVCVNLSAVTDSPMYASIEVLYK